MSEHSHVYNNVICETCGTMHHACAECGALIGWETCHGSPEAAAAAHPASLPTEEGSIIGYSYYYDGRNYAVGVLTHDTRYALDGNGKERYEKVVDPEDGEEYEEAIEEYDGLMWQMSGEARPLTPDEANERFRVKRYERTDGKGYTLPYFDIPEGHLWVQILRVGNDR